MNDPQLMSALIRATMDGDLFTYDEARALIRSVVTETPEELPDTLERVLLWARNARKMHGILEAVLKANKAADDAIVQVTFHEGDDAPSFRLRPGMQVEIINEGLGLERVEFET